MGWDDFCVLVKSTWFERAAHVNAKRSFTAFFSLTFGVRMFEEKLTLF